MHKGLSSSDLRDYHPLRLNTIPDEIQPNKKNPSKNARLIHHISLIIKKNKGFSLFYVVFARRY